MTTGVTCTVFVDGVRAADGCYGDEVDQPTILEDLKVTWGRSDTMSQPSPDSCSFSVVDPVGGEAFTGLYHTGSRIDVLAHGEGFPDPSQPTFVNPGFETADVTWSASGGTAARTTTRVHSGANALRVIPNTAGQPVTLWLAPGAFQPAGTNPDAWDSIPITEAGQSWSASVALWLPEGATATVRGALFSGPYAAAGQPAGAAEVVHGNGAWQVITAQRAIQVDDRWLGFHIVLDPSGPAWDEMPPALTWDGLDPSASWDDYGSVVVDDAQVTSPAGSSIGRGVLVFSGRITDLAASWDDSFGSPVVEVTATGFTADLDNRTVGDEPWLVESIDVRAQRILNLAGLPISIEIDDTVAGILVSYRDVDSQGATGLLQELAVSVDGVLWPAVHQSLGAYLKLEDPGLRASLLKFAEDGTGTIVIVQTDPDIGFDLSACVVLRDPVTWVQDVSDVTTRVAVGWKVQDVDEEGLPTTTDATEKLVNPALEATYGTRGLSISTQLQSAADAIQVAQGALARTAPGGWRASGLAIDDDDVTGDLVGIGLMLDLLDGTSRIGAPIVVGDLPIWSPAGSEAGVYLEGGTYRYVAGRWVLELLVSAAGGGIGQSAEWDQLTPTWTWDQWDPDITWNDIRGVAAP